MGHTGQGGGVLKRDEVSYVLFKSPTSGLNANQVIKILSESGMVGGVYFGHILFNRIRHH